LLDNAKRGGMMENIDDNGAEKVKNKSQQPKKPLSDKDFSIDMSDLQMNNKTIDLLVANVIPTTKYFESRFDNMQFQIDRVNQDMNAFKQDVSKSFEQVDKRFEQVDKRFEQVDKRFEQVDKRFEQVNAKLDTIIERMDVKIDAGLRENRSMTFKLFSFAMIFSAISMAGLLGKLTGLF
jgi:methyl-accepting chemotaxis protein